MLTTDTFEKALDLLDSGYTFPSITEETGITTEDAEAVHVVWFNGTSEEVSRELQLAGVLEAAATKLRTGQGWDEGTTGDVLHEILRVYPKHTKKEWVEANLGVTVRRVHQLLSEGAEPRETISLGSKRPRKLRAGDWRGLLKATERRTAQEFGSAKDSKRLAVTIRNFAQRIADRYTRPGRKLVVSVSLKTRK